MQEIITIVVALVLRVGLPLLLLGAVAGLGVLVAWRRWEGRFAAGDIVPAGLYWSPRSMRFIAVAEPRGLLPGGPGQRYMRTPGLIAAIAAPLIGLLFIVLLPALMLGFVAWLAVHPLYQRVLHPDRVRIRRIY